MSPINIALIGVGKIARDQHLPAITAQRELQLVAAVSPHQRLEAVANFTTLESLLSEGPQVHAVSICTPPQVRYAIARHALESSLHVMLEKPPGATLNEVVALQELAARNNVTLFASWHSREAAGVEPARSWLAARRIRSVRVAWKEDVRVWHPGQQWIFEAGGLGVFDPGINALSILTRILPAPLILKEATLVFPSNRQAPIAASLALDCAGAVVEMQLDFLQTGPQTWDIDVQTDGGLLQLARGGAQLRIDGVERSVAGDGEYPRLYRHFLGLLATRTSDVDLTPLRLVADAFLCGRRREAAPFHE